MTTTNNIKDIVKGHLKSALFNIENPRPDYRGKVRDIFERGEHLIMVTSDRVSAFDQVLGTIPLKGALLCEQAHWWFKQVQSLCPTHFIDRPDPQIFVVKKAQAIKVEMIVRGFLAGSLMREDKNLRGQAYGLKLDPNLKNYERLESPIITPTTKGAVGEHDLPLCPEQIISSGLLTQKHWQKIAAIALNLFKLGSEVAQSRGLYLVDTKYEFGMLGDDIILIDEIHTSDSSRFFLIDDYQQKMALEVPPMMLDKEFLRQHILATLGPDAPHRLEHYQLTDEVRIELGERYFRLTEQLTGQDFSAPKLGAIERISQFTNQLKIHARRIPFQ
jgi:phosphoribosylaminoimidazole-succinocarboxamide synthase